MVTYVERFSKVFITKKSYLEYTYLSDLTEIKIWNNAAYTFCLMIYLLKHNYYNLATNLGTLTNISGNRYRIIFYKDYLDLCDFVNASFNEFGLEINKNCEVVNLKINNIKYKDKKFLNYLKTLFKLEGII